MIARLHSEDLERLADLVADRVADRLSGMQDAASASAACLVDARALAQLLGVSVDFVRAHALELGGQKLSASTKAPWRFDVEDARARLAGRMAADRSATPVAGRATAGGRRRRSTREPGRSLAIRGDEG